MTNKENRALIIGGSLAGLFTGVLLRSIGWEVDIYERSPHALDSRGGGIVLQPDTEAAFRQAGIPLDGLGVVAKERYYLQRDGRIEQMPMRQTLTSWNMLYNAMKRHLPNENYHQDKTLEKFDQAGEKVTAIFTDGDRQAGDMLIGADGPTSSVRQQLLPTYEPKYAGYVGYRGLVDESDLDSETAEILTERFVFYQIENSHILQYVIPGENESLAPSERRALAESLVDHNHDIPIALKSWEHDQLALGMHLWKHGQSLGDRSQFMYGKERFANLSTLRA